MAVGKKAPATNKVQTEKKVSKGVTSMSNPTVAMTPAMVMAIKNSPKGVLPSAIAKKIK